MKTVGVIGSGSFGLTLAKILSRNIDVLMYSRNENTVNSINNTHTHMSYSLRDNVYATDDISAFCAECSLIFAVVPSQNFRMMMREFSPYLKPSHIIIQGTKGLDVSQINTDDYVNMTFTKDDVCTMSEVIRQESNVVRVGCISGPNLAREILEGQPAATVIASEFDEVIKLGQDVLESKKFFAFGSYDLKAAEIAGRLKILLL